MDGLLKSKQTITSNSGVQCEIVRMLGDGGQGEVYEVAVAGKPMALKWYFSHCATDEQYTIIANLVQKGSPGACFLWPLDIIRNNKGFGYIMPLRGAEYVGVNQWLKRKVILSYTALCEAGRQLADSFLTLHSNGLCYSDINRENVFLNPKTGDVLICDNDNVTVDGERSGSVFTLGLAAPELVRKEACSSIQTDLFSLAVLLFYLFVGGHPLDGQAEAAIKCMDLPAKEKLYGHNPVFIYDPVNHSNRPVPGIHNNTIEMWPMIPQLLKNLFTQSFTTGITDPQNGRVRESIWREAMIRTKDSICNCPNCSAENFYSTEAQQSLGCWYCRKPIQLPYLLQIKKHMIPLNLGKQIYPHHIDANHLNDFSNPAGVVCQHPQNPKVWGIKNLTSQNWSLTTKDGALRDVEPGRSVTIAAGTKIHFGNVDGEIVQA